MSLQAVVWALGQKHLTPSAKLTLVCVANYANDEWAAWPKQETLADDTGLDVRTVRRTTEVLEDAGLVRTEPWLDASGRKIGIRYNLSGPQSDTTSAPTGHNVRFLYNPVNEPKENNLKKDYFPELKLNSGKEPTERHSLQANKDRTEWPEADHWLRDFLNTGQRAFNGHHLPQLLDPGWWEAVSIETNGISRPFLERNFAAMQRWIMENPARMPTPRGVRRFVGGWLRREAERERRYGNGNQVTRR